jgi:hypothetical protein
MIPHDKYDYIQVENILTAARYLIDELSYIDENGKTELYQEITFDKKNRLRLIQAINILKHQMKPSHE